MTRSHSELIHRFYEAFSRRDHEAMAACYHPDATFSDPVFPHLAGSDIAAMWRMPCLRGTDLELVFRGVEADDRRGSAHWEAIYTFSSTGKKVHNRIAASFEFADGKMLRHVDAFDFYRWSRMALGPVGWLLGWTPLLHKKVQKQAGRQLERFIDKESMS